MNPKVKTMSISKRTNSGSGSHQSRKLTEIAVMLTDDLFGMQIASSMRQNFLSQNSLLVQH